jgi:hypothetical protein
MDILRGFRGDLYKPLSNLALKFSNIFPPHAQLSPNCGNPFPNLRQFLFTHAAQLSRQNNTIRLNTSPNMAEIYAPDSHNPWVMIQLVVMSSILGVELEARNT